MKDGNKETPLFIAVRHLVISLIRGSQKNPAYSGSPAWESQKIARKPEKCGITQKKSGKASSNQMGKPEKFRWNKPEILTQREARWE